MHAWKFLFLLAVWCNLVATVLALPPRAPVCQEALAPPTNARGVNRARRDSDTPLYRLHFSLRLAPNETRHEAQRYRVHLSAKNELLPFSDAKISIATEGSCGSGSFIFDPLTFNEVKQSDPICPRQFFTTKKTPMTEMPALLWTPPSCGCVRFRAMVIEDGKVYYADSEDVENGPLTQTACVQNNEPREQYLDALCHVSERYSAADLLSRPSFLSRHQLEVRWMDRYGLEMALELRRADNGLCCRQKSSETRRTCFGDTRRRRIDRFCEDGYPDIPFTSFRSAYMRDREKKCCFILGEHRYPCFAVDDDSDFGNDTRATFLDFSQDEADPVNDLAEFSSLKDKDVVRLLATVKFDSGNNGADDDNDDNDSDDEDSKEYDGNKDKDSKEKPSADDEIKKNKYPPSPTTTEQAIRKTTDEVIEATTSQSVPAKMPVSEGVVKKQSVHSGPTATSRPNGKKAEQQPKSGDKVKPTSTDEESKITPTASKVVIKTSTESRNLPSVMEKRRKNAGKSGEVPAIPRGNSQEILGPVRGRSRERYGSRLTSAERRSSLPRRTSFERFPALGRTPDTLLGSSRGTEDPAQISPRLSSVEKKARMRSNGQRRRQEAGDVEGFVEEDIEDQGGSSVDETLNKLHRRMERLKLKSQCCEAGALAGSHVYGRFTQAWNECGHSGDKYLRSSSITSGSNVCWEQFRKCCIELAVSGPTMTSSEFRDAEFMYLNNMDRIDPVSDMAGHQSEGLQRGQHGEPSDQYSRKVNSPDTAWRETPEAYDLDSEKRYQSMRTVTNGRPQVDEDGDEIDGPRRFDEADNDNANDHFDDLKRDEKVLETKKVKSKSNDEEVEFDERSFVDNGDDDDEGEEGAGDDDEDDDLDNDDNDDADGMVGQKRNTTDKGKAGKESYKHVKLTRSEDEISNEKEETKSPKHDQKLEQVAPRHQLDRNSEDIGVKKNSRLSSRLEPYEDSLLAAAASKENPRYFRKNRVGGRSKSRRNRSRASRRRSSRRRSSKKTSKEGRWPFSNTNYRYQSQHQFVPYLHQAALDSQEMAAAHVRNIHGALDSKEMADAYRRRQPVMSEYSRDVSGGASSRTKRRIKNV